jgi:hypothetical protein
MNRSRALHLIRESLELAKTAPVDKKIQLLKLVKECYQRINQRKDTVVITESTTESTIDPDYVKEK